MKIKNTFTALFIALITIQFAEAAIVYVKKGATGTNNGTSWTNAYTDLKTAITNAASGSDLYISGDTFYLPTGSSRANNFTITNKSLSLYGGFPNTGNPTFNQRNITTYRTIVSGDNSKNDVSIGSGITSSHSSRTDNAYHVFAISFASGTYSVLFDGLTISGANANGSNQDLYGAGIYYSRTANGNGSQQQDIKIYNCIFENNSAKQGACFFTSFGFLKCDYVNLILVGNQIRNNYSEDFLISNFTAPTNTNVDYNVFLWNNLIHNNYMADNSSALLYCGGAENNAANSNFAYNIHFNTFAKNINNSFGMLLVEGPKLSSLYNAVKISNNIFYDNNMKSAMISRLGKSKFPTHVIDHNVMEVNDSFLMKYDGGNNKIINVNPFKDKNNNDFSLSDCSPLINDGNLTITYPDKTNTINISMPVSVDALNKNRLNHGYYDKGAIEYSGNKFTAKTDISNAICFGESLQFNGKTITVSGIYYDTMKTHTGCDSLIINTVNVNDSLQARIGLQYDQNTSKWYYGCLRAGKYIFNTYQWYINDTLVPNATNYFIEQTKYGKYYCKVTYSQNGVICHSQSPDYVFQNPNQTSIQSIELNLLSVRPNPANNIIQWNNIGYGTAKLYNQLGQLIMSTNESEMNIEQLPIGIYYLKFSEASGAVKVIKQQ